MMCCGTRTAASYYKMDLSTVVLVVVHAGLVFGQFGAILEHNMRSRGSGVKLTSSGDTEVVGADTTGTFSDSMYGTTTGSDVKLFEGDIIYTKEVQQMVDGVETKGSESLFDAALNKQWPRGVVPYTIETRDARALESAIYAAVREYNRQLNGCIKWQKYQSRNAIRTAGYRNYVVFYQGQGCFSSIGMVGRGEQKISLGRGCLQRGTVMHEMMHALGFWHEQSRPDRDQHIWIYEDNIMQGMAFNFNKYKTNTATTYNEPYDIYSVMHYPPKAFSHNGRPTIVHKQGVTGFGWRQNLSPVDIRQLQKYYRCNTGTTGGGTKTGQVNGGWGPWSEYSRCTKTCGGGTQTKRRYCNNPTPKNGGRTCPGDSLYTRNCNTKPCFTARVDGGWSGWSAYGACTKKCGGGTKTKRRWCNNPVPKNEGRPCPGPGSKTTRCNTQSCTSAQVCTDIKSFCTSWAYSGYCNHPRYQPYMSINCRRSCRLCR